MMALAVNSSSLADRHLESRVCAESGTGAPDNPAMTSGAGRIGILQQLASRIDGGLWPLDAPQG